MQFDFPANFLFKPKLKLVRNAIRPLYMRFRATVRVYVIKVALNLMPTSSLTVQEEVLMSDFLDQRKNCSVKAHSCFN